MRVSILGNVEGGRLIKLTPPQVFFKYFVQAFR